MMLANGSTMWSIENIATEGLMSSAPVDILVFSVAIVVVISYLELGSKTTEQQGGFGIKLAKELEEGGIEFPTEGPVLIKLSLNAFDIAEGSLDSVLPFKKASGRFL